MFQLFARTSPLVKTQTRHYKKTIAQLYQENPKAFKDAKVLMRVDFNVPFLNKDGKTITDDTRIREAIPTIKFLVEAGSKLILTSHCSRPKGVVNEKMRMFPMANRLSELLEHPVKITQDCIGPEVDEAVSKMSAGDILMLENTRFYKNEESNDPDFAKNLAKHADIYVNDSFGTAHRAHASTHGVCDFVGHKVAGLLMEKELNFLKNAVDAPVRPFGAIVGGAKVSSKIPVIKTLIGKCDKVFIGGGMIFTFYRAMGLNVGNSMVEEEFIPMARELMDLAKEKGVELVLPSDVIVAKEFNADAEAQQVPVSSIPEGWMGLDIGSETLQQFNEKLSDCKTVLWNGPMGVFEFDRFSRGTFGIAETLANLTDKGATTIIGGGDSVAAVRKANLSERMSHISTGGGASLEMLEGKVLPGVEALQDA